MTRYAAKAFAAFLVYAVNALAAGPSADVAALEALDEAWAKAFSSGNADAVANIYDERAVLLPPGAPRVNGRAQIHDFFKKEIDGAAKAGLVVSLGGKPQTGISGDMGWLPGTYGVKDKAGKAVEIGKYLVVAAKKHGKWLYVRDAWNADAAPPPPPPAPAAKKK